MTESIVYVVDDDPSMREALSSLIRSVGWRVETFASTQEFLDYRRPSAPSCLVLDVQLGEASGLDLAERLNASGVQIPIVFITGHGTIPMTVRAMKGGAVEFLTKPFRNADLIAGIEQALERDQAALRERAELAEIRLKVASLTSRECEVLALVVTGQLNKQIASALGTSEQTIKAHRGRVTRKLGVTSVAELVRLVERVEGQSWAPACLRK
jgi:FixJ family two-component response regulator